MAQHLKKIGDTFFKHRFFGSLIAFRFMTTIAMQMKMTILSYFLYKITDTPLSLGLLGLYEALPRIAMSLPAGVLVERMNKRTALLIVVVSYFFLALAMFCAMLFIPHNSAILPSIFYLIVMILGFVGSLGPSATFSIFSHIIPKEETARYSALNSNAWQVGAVIGPILGGFLMAQIGELYAVAIVAAILFLAIIFALRLPSIPSENRAAFNWSNSWREMKEGVAFVFSNKTLLWAISLDLFAVLFGGAVALLPVYAEDILHVGSAGYGLLRAGMPVGSALTMIFLAARPLKKNTGLWLLFSVLCFGIFTIIFGISTNMYLSLFALFMIGCFDAVSVIVRSTLLVLETPMDMKARVSSVNSMFISSSNEIGAFESGFAAQILGTVRSVVFGGCMTILFALTAFAKSKELRNFELK